MSVPYLVPLDADTQRNFGVSEVWPMAIAGKVQFSELDPLNHVNNRAYLAWFENCRVSYFRNLDLEALQGVYPRLVLRNIGVHYIQELTFGDDYIATTRTTELRRTSFTMKHEVWGANGLCTRAEAVVVLLDPANRERMPLSDAMRAYLIENDGAQQL